MMLTMLTMLYEESDIRGIAIRDWQLSVIRLENFEEFLWPKTL